MEIKQLKKILFDNRIYIMVIPIITAIIVYLFTFSKEEVYKSSVLLYTGLSAGSSDSGKINFSKINNDLLNVISISQTSPNKEDILVRVIAEHLYNLENGSEGGNPEPYNSALKKTIDEKNRLRFYDSISIDSTYKKLKRGFVRKESALRKLIFDNSSPYNIAQMSNLKIGKGISSDILNINFSSSNAKFCQQILKQATEVLKNNFKIIKSSENDKKVAFFKQKLENTENELNNVEKRLSDFKNANNIINFPEQTKILVYDRQTAFNNVENAKMKMLAAQYNLTKIEKKLNDNNNFFTTNTELLKKREKLSRLVKDFTKDTLNNIYQNLDIKTKQIASLRDEIQQDIFKVYSVENSEEGISSDILLNQWLDNYVKLNEQEVYYNSLNKKFNTINGQIKSYTPVEVMLKKLEREIELKESEYIEVLRAYQRSVLAQQENSFSNNLVVLESGEYTTVKTPKQTLYLSFIGFAFGLFSVLAVTLLRAFLKIPSLNLNA